MLVGAVAAVAVVGVVTIKETKVIPAPNSHLTQSRRISGLGDLQRPIGCSSRLTRLQPTVARRPGELPMLPLSTTTFYPVAS